MGSWIPWNWHKLYVVRNADSNIYGTSCFDFLSAWSDLKQMVIWFGCWDDLSLGCHASFLQTHSPPNNGPLLATRWGKLLRPCHSVSLCMVCFFIFLHIDFCFLLGTIPPCFYHHHNDLYCPSSRWPGSISVQCGLVSLLRWRLQPLLTSDGGGGFSGWVQNIDTDMLFVGWKPTQKQLRPPDDHQRSVAVLWSVTWQVYLIQRASKGGRRQRWPFKAEAEWPKTQYSLLGNGREGA